MTGPVPPGHGGLPGRLAEMERRINELSRCSAQVPICVVRLGADVRVGPGDLRPVASWKPTAETDLSGMYHYNEGGDTFWQLPNAGRYALTVQTLWGGYGVFDAGRPPMVGTSLLLNSSGSHLPETYAIAQNTAFNPNISSDYTFTCEDRTFSTGDRIRVNFWSQFGGTVNAQHVQTFTHVVIRYLGSV